MHLFKGIVLYYIHMQAKWKECYSERIRNHQYTFYKKEHSKLVKKLRKLISSAVYNWSYTKFGRKR